jgi:hypothetical protein
VHAATWGIVAAQDIHGLAQLLYWSLGEDKARLLIRALREAMSPRVQQQKLKRRA